jgi:hypothetical protein
MIVIDDTLISEDLLEKKFVCDLNACKGACCVAGDSGAPLDRAELRVLEDIFDKVKPFMTPKGIRAVEKQGPYVIDEDGDYTTTLVSEKAECAFVYFDETKTAKCAIEKAHAAGIIDWKKPLSCHLYPVRITKYRKYDAVNYHSWEVCKPACDCGTKLGVPVYRFLKEPLIRKYGADWYMQLEKSANIISNEK